jgi:flagellar motor switch protein FliN
MKGRTLVEAAAEDLGVIIGGLLDAPATVAAADGAGAASWIVRLTFEGPLTGTLTVGLEADDAATLARLVMGLEDAPPAPAISDTLVELCSQAMTSLGERDDFKGLRLAASHVVAEAPAGTPVRFAVTAGDRFSGGLLLWDKSVVAARPREGLGASSGLGGATPANLDMILDIDLPLAIRFGQTEMTLGELTALGPGSVIDLGRAPEDPVDVLVHGRLVARGEVVVVSGNYGVRITDVISAADRLRTVAG